jgi:hypothetical protein
VRPACGQRVKRSKAVKKSKGPACVSDERKSTSGPSAEQLEALESQVAEVVLSIVGEDVERDVPLMEAGLDSLGAVELRNSLESFDFGAGYLPASILSDYPSVATLLGFLATMWVPDTTDALTDDSETDTDLVTFVDGEEDYTFSALARVPNCVFISPKQEPPSLQSQIVDTMTTILAYDPASEEELIVDGEMNPDEALVLFDQLAHIAGIKLAMLPMSLSSNYPTAAALSDFLASAASLVEFDGEETDWDCAVFKGKKDAFPQPKNGNERLAKESSWTRGLLHGLVCDAVRDISGVSGLDGSENLSGRILNDDDATRLRFELAHLVGVVMLPPVFTSEYPSIDAVVDYLLSLIQGESSS